MVVSEPSNEDFKKSPEDGKKKRQRNSNQAQGRTSKQGFGEILRIFLGNSNIRRMWTDPNPILFDENRVGWVEERCGREQGEGRGGY